MRLTRNLGMKELTAMDLGYQERRAQDPQSRDSGPRNLRAEAEAWVRAMEDGYYPLFSSAIDPGLKAEVVRQIRARLADGSEWLRKFLFEHASESIHSMPELHEELNAITRYHNANDYIRQLDEWAISVWQRFPLQQSQILP